MSDAPISLVEFPADDPERAQRFWSGVLGVELRDRTDTEGQGWQTHSGGAELGLHRRGRGPGDTVSLPYFAVPSVEEAVQRVTSLGGTVIHPGERFAICKDSEGSPFGLMRAEPSAASGLSMTRYAPHAILTGDGEVALASAAAATRCVSGPS